MTICYQPGHIAQEVPCIISVSECKIRFRLKIIRHEHKTFLPQIIATHHHAIKSSKIDS